MDKTKSKKTDLKKFITLLSVVMILTTGMMAAARGPKMTGIRSDDEQKSIQLNGLMLETVENKGDVGKHTSVKIENDRIYVSYYSKSSGNLKLARKALHSSGEGWKIWSIDRVGDVGEYSSLDVFEDEVHISYYDRTNEHLKYVLWSGSRIRLKETVDSRPDVGKYSSIAVDETGRPHISYYDDSEGDLEYAVKENGEWKTETVQSAGDVGRFSSIALHDSKPHISFYDWDERDLIYAKKVGSSWSDNIITEAGELAGKYTSIEVDDNGYAHISCYGWTDDKPRLKYVSNSDGGDWKGRSIDTDSDHVGTYTSIELIDGKPVISYHEWDEKSLKLASKSDTGNWEIKNIDTQYMVGTHSSLEVIENGEVHITYYDQTHGDLKHARYFLHNTTPLAPENFKTRSEYGKIMLEWDTPRFDGIMDGNNSILGYNIYRSDGDSFRLMKRNLTGLSYTDDIPTEKEGETFRYRVAARNRKGVGDNTTTIKTKARYFGYKSEGPMTNRYRIKDLLKIGKSGSPNSYTIRWDFDLKSGENPNWDEVSHSTETIHTYQKVGLKNVLLEIENSAGKKRRYLQSAWIVGDLTLTSTYEIKGSNEIFFHIPEDTSYLENFDNDTRLKNTYVLKGPKELPYRYMDFNFLGNTYSKGRAQKEERLKPEAVDENGTAMWNQTLDVSDAKKDTRVTTEIYLYNRYRNSIEQTFNRSMSGKRNLEKKVDMMNTPDWFHPVLDLVEAEYLTIKNQRSDSFYHGWNVSMEIPSPGKIKAMEISSVSGIGLNKLKKFFGGDYGFKLDLFPEGAIKFSNKPETLGIETTLFKFQTALGNTKNKTDSFKNSFGKPIDYASEVKKEITVGIAVDLKIDEEGIEVAGDLEVGLGAEISIDIPLYSIGIAEVGLTASIGGSIGVTFNIGGLSYAKDKGLAPMPPDIDDVPINLGVNFGGGPYGEVGEGLARVQGKFIMDLGVSIKIPSLSRDLALSGRFEVLVEALYGMWEKSKSWKLFSTNFSSALMRMKKGGLNRQELFSLDRLFTRDYGKRLDPSYDILENNSSYRTKLEENVGPGSDPQIAFTNDSHGISVWSSLSQNPDGSVQSDLYMRRYDGTGWSEVRAIKSSKDQMEYDPQLVVIGENGSERIALMYSEIQSNISGSVNIREFYKNNSLRCLVWLPEKGSWSGTGLNHTVDNKSITSFDVCSNGSGGLRAVYRTGNVSIDIFNASLSEKGTIGVLRGDPSSSDWTKLFDISENNLSASSTPSIAYADGKGAVLYKLTEETGSQNSPYLNRTVLMEIESKKVHTLRETSNSTSYGLLSNIGADITASWVENRTEIMRREIDVNDSWSLSDLETVYSGRTVSSLQHHTNATGEFYTFQTGKNAVPKMIQSKGQGWGYLRSVSKSRSYAQVDYGFGAGTPKMVLTDKENVIESWHSARYSFNGLTGDEVKDRSDENNTGELFGDYSREENSLEGYGKCLVLDKKDEKMRIAHNDSLELTSDTESFTITSLINIDKKSEGYLMKKNSSWAVRYDKGKIVMELWNGSGKFKKRIEDLRVPTDRWVFMGIRYDHTGYNTYLNVTLRNKTRDGGDLLSERTIRYQLGDTGAINSSVEPIVIGGYPAGLKIDDVRLARRYLPDASIQKINRSAYPDFDKEYTVSTQNIPLYVNFTSIGDKVVGEPVTFEGKSLSSNLNWTWTFENGEKRYGKDITHSFDQTGYRTVKLKVKHDVSGAKATRYRTFHVIDVDPPSFQGITSVNELGNQSVKLNWSCAVGETPPFEYHVHHVKGDDHSINTNVWEESTHNTSIVLRGLEPDVKHRVKVTASNDLGLTNESGRTFNFTLEDMSPPEFGGLKDAYIVDHVKRKIRLRWDRARDHSENITYKIYHSKAEKGLNFTTSYTSVKNENDIDLTVSDLGIHHFAVKAVDQEGNIDDNRIIREVKVEDELDPYLEIENSTSKEIVRSEFTLEWRAGDNQSGLSKFWVSTDYGLLSKVDAEDHTFTFEDLPDGERRLTVKAMDGGNNTVKESITVTVVQNDTPYFEDFSPENGTEGLSRNVTLKTRAVDPNEHLMDVKFLDSEGNIIDEKMNVTSGTNVSTVWKDLKSGKTYRWKAVLSDGYGRTESEIREFTVKNKSGQRDGDEHNIAPERPLDPHPKDGKADLGTNVSLSVKVEDPEDDMLNVSFYDGDDRLIGKDEGVKSGGTASMDWNGLKRNATYHWYAVVDDGQNETRSNVWIFNTVEENKNAPPKRPVDPLPVDGASDLGTNTALSVEVYDSDDSVLEISFYDAKTDKLIDSVSEVESGGTVQIDWKGLEKNRTYRWYAVATDGKNETRSEIWKFSTVDKDQNAPPKRPVDPLPVDGAGKLGTEVTLSAEVYDSEGDTLDVSFYNAEDEELVGEDTNVESGGVASVKWTDLEKGRTYSWYAVVTDGHNRTRSDTWTFNTAEKDQNTAPERPKLVSPEDESENLGTNVSLSVRVSDEDDDYLKVEFYNFENDKPIAIDRKVKSGGSSQVHWPDLVKNRTYRWYAVVSDGDTETRSDTWRFTTASESENAPPKKPIEPSPEDGASELKTNVTLAVTVYDSDSDSLNVSFYDGRGRLIDTVEDVQSGTTAEVKWNSLEDGSTYGWHVEIEDGEETITSDEWSFKTASEEEDGSQENTDGKTEKPQGSGEILSPVQIALIIMLAALIGVLIFFYHRSDGEIVK